MKNKLSRILFVATLSFTFINNIKADIAVGSTVKVDSDTWVVTDVNDASDKCSIDNPNEPDGFKVTSKEYPTIGYTYENTCTEGGWVSTTTYTTAMRYYQIKYPQYTGATSTGGGDSFECSGECTFPGKVSSTSTSNILASTDVLNSFENLTIKNISENRLLNNNYDSNKENNIIKISAPEPYEYVFQRDYPEPWTGGLSIYAAELKTKGYFLSYFDYCEGHKVRQCKRNNLVCTEGTEETGSICTIQTDYTYVIGETISRDNFPNNNNLKPTSKEEFDALIPEPGGCPGYSSVEVYAASDCVGEWYRAPITTSKFVCRQVRPTKVEVYGHELSINGKEAYCVTPSAGYNKTYKWDTNFDASKCKNSLQVYNDDGSVSYDIDCGYAYILTEGKRLNIEAGKEVFSYGAIETAMKLFGTGITGNDSSLGEITGKEYLQAGGYYASYYGWGYGEYVGIPWLRGDGIDRSGWPLIYQYFMPEFYSIYIRTAKVSSTYLKENIRYADVGNIKDSSGNYITDPFYYLNPKECKETFKNCSSSSIQLEYNDDYSLDVIASFSPNDSSIYDYLQAGGIKSECSDESGLGVMCGLKNEKGNAEYIKAIYLYIRALQGNELELDTIIEDIGLKMTDEEKLNAILHPQYKPIEGQTKILYEVDENGETKTVIRYAIDTKVTNETTTNEIEVDCDWTDPDTKDYCKAEVFVFDSSGKPVYTSDHYDYCKKNYCYVEIKSSMICEENQESSKLTSLVVTLPNLKSTLIKKIDNGIKGEQIIFVYDDTGNITGGFCQEIAASKETLNVKCPCNPKEQPNLVEQNGNIKDKNYCSKNYNAYDELYYGDPSMSSIINACYEEDKLKYDYTEDLNANGNDIYYDAELESKYSFQVKSDDFGVCTLYCRDETRFYIGNKMSVKAGQNLRYDIGQSLIDKKIINETAIDKGVTDTGNKNTEYNYMPSVVLQLRECTSEIDYDKWEKLYKSAKTQKEKNQLLYSIYNCNLYTTDDIRDKIESGKIKYNIMNENAKNYSDLNGYAEPAMIEYSYNVNDGTINIDNIYGTTKDYLLAQEGCTSLGLNQTDCANYFLNHYSDDYYNANSSENLGITLDFEHGLVDSNLNETIYCSGEACYKLKGSDGKYYYNPNAVGKNDYTTVDNIYDDNGSIIKYESGKILSYSQWGLNYQKYDKDSENYKSKIIDGNEVPTNEYASFIVVTETGFYNKQEYYADSYSGIIRNTPNENESIKSVKLDKNILPLHLDKETGSYEISHTFSDIKTAYKRNTYYTEKNYSLFDNINNKPGEINYICTYDVYNTTTKYEGDDSKKLGFIYRPVNLEDVFESVTNDSRDFPENWATDFGQNTLNQIQLSSENILEQPGDNDEDNSYLEYSYTLTPEGINRIREYNTTSESSGGYLENTLYGCQYDEEEEIFYNCKSEFLSDLNDLNGEFSGLIIINKNDGVSEFCTSIENESQPYCKYQQKYVSGVLVGGE